MTERTGTERGSATTGAEPAAAAPAAEPTTEVEPLRTNDRTTVLVGCAVWAVLLVLGLVNRRTLEAEGHGWWVWTCVAGLVLGLVGLAWLQVRHRRLVASGRAPSKSPTG